MFDYAFHRPAINDNTPIMGTPVMRVQVVEQALVLLDQALTILDEENLSVAAAKVDEARCALRETAGSA
jgi:hypothetical protein